MNISPVRTTDQITVNPDSQRGLRGLKGDEATRDGAASMRLVHSGDKWRALKMVVAFLFGAASFLFLFRLGEAVRPGLVMGLGAASFLACQYLLSRGNPKAARTDWGMVLAMNALPVALLMGVLVGLGVPLRAGAQRLMALAVVTLGLGCSYAGAVVAAWTAPKLGNSKTSVTSEFENKLLARRLLEEVVNTGAVQRLSDFLAPDYRAPHLGMAGIDQAREHLLTFRHCYPDMVVTVEGQVAEGDIVATWYVMRATHLGAFAGVAATGKRITLRAVNVQRVRDGRIVEHWGGSNSLEALLELGVVWWACDLGTANRAAQLLSAADAQGCQAPLQSRLETDRQSSHKIAN